MREIEIVGPADDDRFLLARDRESAETFHVVADRRLRRLYQAGQTPAASEERAMNPLSPREIQTRIRHGATPDDLAEISDMPIEKIMGFALPVLAEREHIAERARTATLRRRYAEGSVTLDEALRAQSTGGRLDDASWDAWRRDDGRWTVSVAFEAGEPGEFLFDTQGRYVVADSAHARTLIGDTDEASPDMALAQALVDAGASNELVEQLTAARSEEESPDDSFAGPGEDEHATAIDEALAGPEADPAAEPRTPDATVASVSLSELFEDDDPPAGVASLKRARDRRAMGQLALGDLDDYDDGSAVSPEAPPARAAEEPDEPSRPTPVADASSLRQRDETVGRPEPVPDDGPAGPAEPVSEAPQVTEASEDSAAEEQARPKKRERRRVPSWDEIMFGNSTS